MVSSEIGSIVTLLKIQCIKTEVLWSTSLLWYRNRAHKNTYVRVKSQLQPFPKFVVWGFFYTEFCYGLRQNTIHRCKVLLIKPNIIWVWFKYSAVVSSPVTMTLMLIAQVNYDRKAVCNVNLLYKIGGCSVGTWT